MQRDQGAPTPHGGPFHLEQQLTQMLMVIAAAAPAAAAAVAAAAAAVAAAKGRGRRLFDPLT